MACLCRLLGVALVASVASQNAASLRRLEEFKNLTLDEKYKAVFQYFGEDPPRAALEAIFDYGKITNATNYKNRMIDRMIDFTVLSRPASHGLVLSMSLARFVRNSTGGFVPSKRSATPTAASPKLNVSVVMSSTENVEGGAAAAGVEGVGGGVVGGVVDGVVFSDMMAGCERLEL